MPTYLNPRNDIAFKKIFGEDKNKDILIHFLNDVLGKKDCDAITEVILTNPTQLPEIAGSKESILDVLCTDKSGAQYIVEMQVSGQKGFVKRAQYYASKAYSSQAKQSDEYHNLKEVIFLAILDFVMFKDEPNYKTDHIILNKETHAHELRDLYFTFIELPKFTKTNPSELLTYEEKWCYFFKHAGELDNMRGFLATIQDDAKIIQKAYDVLEAHNWTEEELKMYDRMDKINKDAKAREAYQFDSGKEQGLEQGIEIGKEQITLNIAISMKKLGLPDEQISLITKLSLAIIQHL